MDGIQTWNVLKNTLIKAATKACGVNKVNKKYKRTAWWNEEIKRELKIKKKKWEEYLTKKNGH